MIHSLPFFYNSLLTHLWQATLLGTSIFLLLSICPQIPARFRFIAYSIALIKFVIPAIFLNALFPSLKTLAQSNWLNASGLNDLLLPPLTIWANQNQMDNTSNLEIFFLSTSLLWLSGFIGLCIWRIHQWIHFKQQVLTPAQPFLPSQQEKIDQLASRMRLNPLKVQAYYTPQNTPLLGVYGLFRSRILVPRDLLKTLNSEETEAILLHELAHIRRRDNLWRLLQEIVCSLFWFHPLIWLLRRQLRGESERACDQQVLALNPCGKAYAASLFKATCYALRVGIPVVSGMSRFQLTTRIREINNYKPKKDSFMKNTSMIVVAILLLTLNSLYANAEPQTTTYSYKDTDQPIRAIHQVQPTYPPESKENHIAGTVKVLFLINEEGLTENIEVIESTDRAFEAPSIEAVSQWTFTAPKVNGKLVKVRVMQILNFNSSQEE